jgi:hypothetical protein
MTRSKKIFLIVAAVFLIIVGLVVMDFARKTTFPGKKTKQQSAAEKSPASVRR